MRENRLISIVAWATSSAKHFFEVVFPVWLDPNKSDVNVKKKKCYAGECSCESCTSESSTDLDIILRSAFFYDWDHVEEEKKKEIKHQNGKLEGKPKQPSHYNIAEFSVQHPCYMSAKCMVAHKHKQFTNGIIDGRHFRTMVQYRLIQGLHMHQRRGIDVIT